MVSQKPHHHLMLKFLTQENFRTKFFFDSINTSYRFLFTEKFSRQRGVIDINSDPSPVEMRCIFA